MNATALHRAPVEAGASGERAEEAAESVVCGSCAATRPDIATVNADIAGARAGIAETAARRERSIRERSVRSHTLPIASPAVLFAGLGLAGGE